MEARKSIRKLSKYFSRWARMVTAEVVGNVYLKLELTGFAEGWVWDIEGD